MAADDKLAELIVSVMRGHRPMTTTEIARAIRKRTGAIADKRSVSYALKDNPRRFVRGHRRFFQRSSRWHLVEVGPVDSPGTAEAPVPARPYPPTLSGAAAAELKFREDEPPTNAVGKIA